LSLINEEWTWADGFHRDKCLGLWRISSLPDPPRSRRSRRNPGIG
jgi:hypothetical protein